MQQFVCITEESFPDRKWQMRSYKREVALALVRQQYQYKLSSKNKYSPSQVVKQKRKWANCAFPEVEKIIGSDSSSHYLLKNVDSAVLNCFVCRFLTEKRVRTIYSCVECGKGYHIDCFTALHFQNALSDNRVLQNKMLKALNALKYRARKSKWVSSLKDLVLECENSERDNDNNNK